MIKPEKAKSSLKFLKSQGMSGSQDQKKTALSVTAIFFGQKFTKAQISFCNDC